MGEMRMSMLQVLEFGQEHSDPTIRSYAAALEAVLVNWRGLGLSDLAAMPAEVEVYLRHAPKFSKGNKRLLRELIWSADTYKQYQRRGRLAIEHANGAHAARLARQAIRDDGWARLGLVLEQLVEAALLPRQALASLARIRDAGRAAGLEPSELSNAAVTALIDEAAPDLRDGLIRGARLLDRVRPYPDAAALLPTQEIGRIDPARQRFRIPEHLQAQLAAWIETATTTTPAGWASDEVREKLTERHSAGSRGIYLAALRNYVHTLGQLRPIGRDEGLPALFGEVDVYGVVCAWERMSGERGGLVPQSMHAYLSDIRRTLERNGCAGHETVAMALATIPILREGGAATQLMSPTTIAWCTDLLGCEEKIRLFETQHWHYERQARAALSEAKAEGFDLVALASAPEALTRMKAPRRRMAKKLLRRARTFGVSASYAAIALEGAALRLQNILGLTIAGRMTSFHDHSRDRVDPHFRIVIPNELLKNGKYLTARGQELPPILIRDRHPGDAGVRILRFHLEQIRPLFPGHRESNLLFPGLGADGRALSAQTFSNWLSTCSRAIGFSLTSHNFRHGICTIQINDDPNCIEELAVLLGDTPRTIRRYYAFLDRKKVLCGMQERIATRRARYRQARTAGRTAERRAA